MNLADLQAQVVRKLQAYAPLVGVTIIAHDGTDGFIESSKERSSALTTSTMGCCITVMPIISDGLIQSGTTGESDAVILSVGIGVAIEENERISRAQGLGIPAETMLQHVFNAVLGPLEGDEIFGSTIGLADPPFENLGVSKGVKAFIAAFSVPLTVTPTP